ncbi:hypothetical protein JCM16303_001929 [Sporobolomyces ruberrimus]
MNDASPPGYSSGATSDSVSAAAPLINLSPPPESTSFQLGYLGHGQAFIAGEVQVKFGASEEQGKPSCARLVVIFRGSERVDGTEAIELCEQRQVLWGEGAAGTSSSTSESSDSPPSNSPFKLLITPDLPVCLHLGSSALEYSITAELHFSDSSRPPIVRCSPVHLARTSPPGSTLADNIIPHSAYPTMSPSTVSLEDPIALSVRLPRTVYRRGEPVELVARIEVPTIQAVRDGLRLRTVSAELVRTIAVKSVTSGSSVTMEEAQNTHRTVLAHSGKSARFSPSRPIIIRLVLHPPSDLACETITQSTILHTVSFDVVVTVGLINLNANNSLSNSSSPNPSPASSDAILTQPIYIVPSAPSPRNSKQKEAEQEHEIVDSEPRWSLFPGPPPAVRLADSPGEGTDGPVPSYVEHGADDPGIPSMSFAEASGSRSARVMWDREGEIDREDDDEEEYDGYEELSIPVPEAGPPPPGIDEDVSPPSPSEPTHERPLPPLRDLGSETPTQRESVVQDLNGLATHSQDRTCSGSPPTSEPSSPPPPLSPLPIVDTVLPIPSEHLPPPYMGDPLPPPPALVSTPPPPLDDDHTPHMNATHERHGSPPHPVRNPIASRPNSPLPPRPLLLETRSTSSAPPPSSSWDPPPYQEEITSHRSEDSHREGETR